MEENVKPFLSGFDLGGWKRDGKIYPHDGGEPIDQWPEEIRCFGNVFTLEKVTPGSHTDKGQWENAIYV